MLYSIKAWEDELDRRDEESSNSPTADDWQFRSVYADWLSDNGYDRRERLQRWLIQHGVRVWNSRNGRRKCWSWCGEYEKKSRAESSLPRSVYQAVKILNLREENEHRAPIFSSRRTAEAILMVALERCGEI